MKVLSFERIFAFYRTEYGKYSVLCWKFGSSFVVKFISLCIESQFVRKIFQFEKVNRRIVICPLNIFTYSNVFKV